MLLHAILHHLGPVANLPQMAVYPFDHRGVGVPQLLRDRVPLAFPLRPPWEPGVTRPPAREYARQRVKELKALYNRGLIGLPGPLAGRRTESTLGCAVLTTMIRS